MTRDLIDRARAGDDEAFRQLIDPHRRELQLHCYRILGSAHDAEDALQETLLAAWQGLAGFEGRASIRTWLYRIATSRCLNALRSASRRPRLDWPPPGIDPPEPTRLSEVFWLQPYPDALLAGIVDDAPGPEARYAAREAISLAFVTVLQLLPPRQRAVLILRDVLGFHASEVARILESTDESVTSALKRARVTMERRLPPAGQRDAAPPPNSATERAVVERLTRAFETGDVAGIVALLTDDVLLSMPPVPLEYQGRALAARFFAAINAGQGGARRLVSTRANGQPACGAYLRDPGTGILRGDGLMVLTLAGDRICAMARFEPTMLSQFELPATLPG